MKVLFISQVFPFPLDTGSRNHIYHWLKALSQKHSVDFMDLEATSSPRATIEGLPNVTVIPLGKLPGKRLKDRVLRLIRSVLTGTPATALVGVTETAKARIKAIRKTCPYGAIVLCESSSGVYAPMLRGVAPTILLKHSVHAVDAKEERKRRGAFSPRWIIEEWVVRRFEARTCRAASVVCAVNTEDATELDRLYRLKKPAVAIPVGVDLDAFPGRGSTPQGKTIGFFGNMAWAANIDAVHWFAKEIMPEVNKIHPDAIFRVIGIGSEQLRKSLTDPHLEFAGRVASIPEAMADVSIGVVPIVSGTGIRFKLLEMLSIGLPIVTTSLGKLGTECLHGQHVMVADDPVTFAEMVNLLLSDSGLRQTLSQRAIELAKRHSWNAIFNRIQELSEETIGEKSDGSAN